MVIYSFYACGVYDFLPFNTIYEACKQAVEDLKDPAVDFLNIWCVSRTITTLSYCETYIEEFEIAESA